MGIVLTGGKSSRMGTNKALLEYHGMAQVGYLAQLLDAYCIQVWASVKNEDSKILLPQLTDQFDLNSPLNGIATAMKQVKNHALLVVPCDMPFIDAGLIEFLINQSGNNMDFWGFYDSNGSRPEPLLGIWEPSSFSKTLDFIKENKSPRDLIENHLNTHLFSVPDKKYLVNINDREAVRKYFPDRKDLL